jgi:hypothetical protein
MTDSNEKYIKIKKERREKKRANKRNATAEEVIYIFEKVLEGWKTIKIFNTIIQNNPKSELLKKNVEAIATGNCKVNRLELCEERFNYYNELRNKVYEKRGIINIPDSIKSSSSNPLRTCSDQDCSNLHDVVQTDYFTINPKISLFQD